MSAGNDDVLREQMKALLGNRCKLCHESNTSLLDIDHRNGDGKEDRERFDNNASSMWNYYLKPEHHGEARYKLQLLCKNHHYMKSIVVGDYSWRRDGKTAVDDAVEQSKGLPFHLMFLDDVGNRQTRESLIEHLLWYLTRRDDRDIHEDVLVAEALKRGIFVDDFEARVTIKRMIYHVPGTVWNGSIFVSRPGYLQLESRRKFRRVDGKLLPVESIARVINPARTSLGDTDS